MVFVCSICTSALSVRPAGLQPGHEIELTATRVCGHLYHQICLGTWFDRQDHPARQCPKCSTVLAEGDTITVRPCGDGDAEDDDHFRQEVIRANQEIVTLQQEANQMHTLFTETLHNSGIEATQNDFLSRELEKLAALNVSLKRDNAEATELLKVNEDSFKTELQKLGRERKAMEDNLGFAESSSVRQKIELETQLQSKQQRIRELEADANELRKSNDYWRREHNLIRRRHGHIDDDDEFMINTTTQTENPEMVNLDERVRKYKQCVQLMESECKILEKMSLQSAASAPCPIAKQMPFSANIGNGVGYRIPSKNPIPISAAVINKGTANDSKRDREECGRAQEVLNGAGLASKFDWSAMAERQNAETQAKVNANYGEMASGEAASNSQVLYLRSRDANGNGDIVRRPLSPSAVPFHPLAAAANGFEGCNHFGNVTTGSQDQTRQNEDIKRDDFEFLNPKLTEFEVPEFD